MRALRVIILLNVLLWCCYAAAWLSGTADTFGTLLALDSSLSQLARHPWTLLTYMALHSSPLHLLLNMACLLFFGYILCKKGMSGWSLALLYICGGLVGGLLYLGFGSETLAGASASVLAVTTFAGLRLPKYHPAFGRIKLPSLAVLAAVALFVALCTSGSTGALAAHLGGALTGAAYALILSRRASAKSREIPGTVKITTPKTQTPAPLENIMDKARVSGFDSLTYSERQALADAPDNLDRK